MNFDFIRKEEEKHTVYNLTGDLLAKENALDLINNIEKCIENKQLYFIFDLMKMNYLNSTGLGVLISLLTKIRNVGGELVVFNIPPKISQLLLITKLNTVFTVANSLENAIDMIDE